MELQGSSSNPSVKQTHVGFPKRRGYVLARRVVSRSIITYASPSSSEADVTTPPHIPHSHGIDDGPEIPKPGVMGLPQSPGAEHASACGSQMWEIQDTENFLS